MGEKKNWWPYYCCGFIKHIKWSQKFGPWCNTKCTFPAIVNFHLKIHFRSDTLLPSPFFPGQLDIQAQPWVCNCSWTPMTTCCPLLPSVVYSFTCRMKSLPDFVGERDGSSKLWLISCDLCPRREHYFCPKNKSPFWWQGLLAVLRLCNVLLSNNVLCVPREGNVYHLFLLNCNLKHTYMWDLLYIVNMSNIQFANSKGVLE